MKIYLKHAILAGMTWVSSLNTHFLQFGFFFPFHSFLIHLLHVHRGTKVPNVVYKANTISLLISPKQDPWTETQGNLQNGESVR
jgi:hypothetical protein